MRTSRFTDQQIIGFLRQAESGLAVKEVCRQACSRRGRSSRRTAKTPAFARQGTTLSQKEPT